MVNIDQDMEIAANERDEERVRLSNLEDKVKDLEKPSSDDETAKKISYAALVVAAISFAWHLLG